MTCYFAQPTDVFVKGYVFLSFLYVWGKILVKIKVKTWVVNAV